MDVAVKMETKKTYYWIIYYLVLGIIQAMWTNLSVFPPTIFRIGMIVASFAPIYTKPSLILLAIPYSIILRGNLSTDFQYLPDIYSYSFYIFIELSAIIVHYKRLNFANFRRFLPLIILMFFIGFVDFINNGQIGPYATHLFIALLIVPFIRTDEDFHLMSSGLIVVCALLAVYYIIMFDSFLVTWNRKEGLERSGWGDPNYFSTLLDYGFLIAAIYMVGKTSENFLLSNKKFLICISVAIFSAVVMTASRAGFLCFALPLLFIFLSKRIKWYWFFLGIAFVIGVSYFLYSKGTFDVLLYRFFEQGNIESGGERTDIWDRGLSNFFNQDFINILFGGGYWHRATLTHGADLHNEFLSVLLDYGLFGLILFLSVIFSNLTFKFKDFFYKNLPVIFFVLTLLSLSPFQSIYVCFLIIWIYSYKDFMSISKYKV